MVSPTQTDMPPPSRLSQPPGNRTAPVKNETTDSPQADLSDDEDSTSQIHDVESISEGAPSLASTQPQGSTAESAGDAPIVPLQKRRRVTRMRLIPLRFFPAGLFPSVNDAYADQTQICNRRVTKCTYDKPSNRRRNPAPQYIEALENKLSRAETLLRKFMPDVDLNDPNLDPSVQQEFRMREKARVQAAALKDQQSSASSSSKDSHLRSMIDSVGQLELNDKGDYDFHGTSSGSVFFKRMKDHFRAFLGRDNQLPSMSKSPRPEGVVTLDSPKSSASSPWSAASLPQTYNLPPKPTALNLCSEALSNATCLLRILHQPSFYEILDGLYSKPPDTFEIEDNRNLALAYSVMALGCMYNVPDKKSAGPLPYKVAMDQGLKYYNSARALLQDITECRDLTSLQALLFMILFIQSISSLSTCYGFVGIALRSALRMGLHRHFPQTQINAIESESRKRVFYVCRQIDTYVSALLGFPLLLNDEDIDQPLPTPVDDQFITTAGILNPPPGTPSFFEAFNAHAKLMNILGKTVRNIYPLKRIEQNAAEGSGAGAEQVNASYSISYAKVKELEEELQQWNEDLPMAWRPNSEGPNEVVRVRNLLRFAFAHVQMVLYRPFLHYVSPRVSAGKTVDERGYACGAAGITVARNIVHLGLEMRKQVSLVGPYWFTFFTEFFAILTLVFFVLENQEKEGSKEILADAIAGKEMISGLARTCLAADKISETLSTIFEQLPDNLKKVKPRSTSSKKRPASGSRATSFMSAASSHQSAESSRIHGHDVGSTKAGKSSVVSPQPTTSFDNDSLQPPGYDDPFSSGFEFSPLDLSTPSSDSAAPAFQDTTHLLQQHATGSVNPIHQLDAMMFPSGDPLAYPNQPRVDFGDHRMGIHGGNSGNLPHHDPSQFYMPSVYDNIEGQLLGPLPPYMMQTQTHAGFDFPAAMYTEPMLPMQHMTHISPPLPPQPQAHNQAQPQFQHQSVRRIIHPNRLHSQQPVQRRRRPRNPEELLANTPWHGMLPQHGVD